MRDSISIAIPTLNEEGNLERCLSSIFRQKFKGKLEIFIIDGGSIDKTLEIAKRFKVKIISNPKKDAESGKMIGLRAATGKYFMILDADMDIAGKSWFDKLLKPLKEDPNITGSYCKYVSKSGDSFLSKFVTLDPIQRDPLFRFLTPGPEVALVEKRKGYWLCKNEAGKIVINGFPIYRRDDLLKLKIDKRYKFMELDTIAIFVKHGYKYFAYTPSLGLHHPFLKDLKTLIRKRIRNLRYQFFNQPDKREFTWINFKSKKDIIKIIFWIIYANTLVLPALVGIYRAIKFNSSIALYEPIFVWITTNLIIYVFLTEKEGRQLVFKKIS